MMDLGSENLQRIFQAGEMGRIREQAERIVQANYPELGKIRQAGLSELIRNIREWDGFGPFAAQLKGLKRHALYQSPVHGHSHVERVAVHTAFLAKLLGVGEAERPALYAMAMYHDVGRENDGEEPGHGMRSAMQVDSLCPEFSPEERRLIKAAAEAHSLPDRQERAVYEKYFGTDESLYGRYRRGLWILKDADALDRFRLSGRSLKVSLLRLPESPQLVTAACEMVLLQPDRCMGE